MLWTFLRSLSTDFCSGRCFANLFVPLKMQIFCNKFSFLVVISLGISQIFFFTQTVFFLLLRSALISQFFLYFRNSFFLKLLCLMIHNISYFIEDCIFYWQKKRWIIEIAFHPPFVSMVVYLKKISLHICWIHSDSHLFSMSLF